MNGVHNLTEAWAQLWREAPARDRLIATSLVATLAGLSYYLWPFWREQSELSHGYFALPCCLALLWNSRNEASWLEWWHQRMRVVAAWSLCLVGGGLCAIAALAALAQGVHHSQTAFLVGLGASSFLMVSVLSLGAGGSSAVRLNGASIAAILLWWFATPLPSGRLSQLTLFLQDIITAGSLRTLHALGIPAIRYGNVIQLADQMVGVEEACSGIRSLTACLFAGTVLGGFMLRGSLRRVTLIAVSGLIAVGANFVRSSVLCIMAAKGVSITGFWHDATAWAVLGITTLTLFLLCQFFAADAPPPIRPSVAPVNGNHRGFDFAHTTFAAFAFALCILVVIKIDPSSGQPTPAPDLPELMSISSPGWLRRTDDTIQSFGKALGTNRLHQETYRRDGTQLTFYLAYWSDEQSSLGSVALHSPDICLPGNGWNSRPLPSANSDYPLPDPRRYYFTKEIDGYPQHVWFWHYFDGRPVGQLPGFYPWQLAPVLLKPGVKAKAPQWVLRISSNQPLETLVDEPLMREFVGRLQRSGLIARVAQP